MTRHFDPKRDFQNTKPNDRIRWGAGVLAVAAICYLVAATGGGDLFSDLALILGLVGLGAIALGLFGK